VRCQRSRWSAVSYFSDRACAFISDGYSRRISRDCQMPRRR
jgi:hypothetical protein